MFKRIIGKIRAKKIIKKANQHNHKVMLHIGCGNNYFHGWINIDNNSDNNIKKLDLNWDLRNKLPFVNNSIDIIYNEHLIEHLTVKQSKRAIKEFFRVLKPNGVLRIAMPDLDDVIKQYLDPDWSKHECIKRFGLDFVKSRAEMININFRWWGHQWLYNWEELERRLKECGAKTIIKCEWANSEFYELRNLEEPVTYFV